MADPDDKKDAEKEKFDANEQDAANYEANYCNELRDGLDTGGIPNTIFRGYMYPINKENEAAAWMVIYKAVNKALGQYPTTLEQDIKILKDEE